MSGNTNLASPICGEISRDGRLLRADEALHKLNLRAGGEPGGVMAIPPLLNFAQLALRLQMRLSRAVRVADDTDYLEMWAEAKPAADIVQLSILSWRTLQNVTASHLPELSYPETPYLRFDRSLRLIRAAGVAVEGLTSRNFGQAATTLLPEFFGQSDALSGLLNCIGSFAASAPGVLSRKADGRRVLASGMPIYDIEGRDVGYDVKLELLKEANDAAASKAASVATPGAIFGKHLAPVLRQPLGRIIANAETIGSELQGPIRENYALYARDIANAARHLSALVDDLGDLEVVERANFSTAPDNIELGDVARRVAGLLALKAADHSIRIRTPAVTEKVTAVAEFRRVLQIMLNVVTNAIRYSPDGTQIDIGMAVEGDRAILSVSDQGAGIAEENREKGFCQIRTPRTVGRRGKRARPVYFAQAGPGNGWGSDG